MLRKIRSCLRFSRHTKKNLSDLNNNQDGNIFFMLFGAVAIVGLLGTAVMSTMRGPLSTMVEIQSRTQAESEMGIASHLALLEATELANAGDCDSDGFVEPLEFMDAGSLGPVGGGFLPNDVASSRVDPWGTEYGYCAWDAGVATGTIGCDIDSDGTNNRLDGNGSATDETYTVIAIVSAGPDQVFSTTCTGGANPSIAKTGDDMVVEFTYASANAASNGLWNLKTGDPTTAEISKNLEITGAASFSAGIDLTNSTVALSLGAASMLFPNETTLSTCNGANDGLIRINTSANPDFLELCDDPNGWVAIGGPSIWQDGAGDDIYYDTGTPQVGIGTSAPSEALDVVGNIDVSGNLNAGGNIATTGNATVGGTLGVTGTTTLGVLNASGAIDFASTLNVTGLITGTSGIYIRNTDTSFAVNTAGHYTGDYRFQVPSGTTRNITFRHTSGGWNAAKIEISKLSGSNHDGTMHLYTTGHGNSQLFLDDQGNVGIGTTSPNAQLHVSGATILTSTLDAQSTISNSTGNITIGDNVDISNDLDVTGDITGENTTVNDKLYVGTTIDVDGDQIGPALNCTSSQKLEWTDGSGWSCVTDLQGGSGGGIPDLNDLGDVAAAAPTNGQCLVYNNVSGDWESASCSGSVTQIFEVTGGAGSEVVSSVDANVPYTTADFVFGSPQLDDDADANHDTRMFFDKSLGAFRVGFVTDTQWDTRGTGSFASGQNGIATGWTSTAMGWTTTASGISSMATGSLTTASGDYSFTTGRTVTASGDGSAAFGLATLANSGGASPTVSGYESIGFFMGNQSGVDLSVSNRMGLYGGDLLIDDDGTTGSQGCIQYNGTTSELEFSDDCTTFTAFSNGALGLWTDLTGGRIHYGTTSASQVGIGTSNPQTTLDVNGGVRVGSVSGGAAPTFMAFDDLSDVAVAAPADGDCVVYNNASGDWESGSCSGGITQIFEVTGGAGSEVVSSIDANVPYTTADFVFGSPQLDDDGDANHDSRMFFDKSKFAFRVGLVTGTQWDDANIGDYSIAMGANTTASGLASTAMGTATTASGLVSTAMGNATTASGDYSTTMGSNTTASGQLSTAMGYDTTASGQTSTAIGHDNTASGVASTAMGEEVNANGSRSFAIGLQSGIQATDPIITGDRSMVLFMDGGVAGANSTYDFTANDKFAVIGGEFQIDDVSASANKGCIRYNSAATELQYSDDCTTYASFASLSSAGAINDLSDAYTDYVTDHNMFFGNTAGNSILAGGNNNVFIGEIAGEDTTSGSYNVFIGKEAGRNNITGEWNTFVGDDAGRANTSGSYNSAFGGYSLRANTDGSQNTAIGDGTLEVNTSGGNNTALGHQALFTSGTGNNNIALGRNALHISNGASNNTAIGTNAGDNITTGDNNIIIGYNVDAASATGDNQINIGNVITGNMATGDIAIIGTAALAHPSGTTAQRPSTGVNGMIRYNSTLNEFEGYENGSWTSMGSGAGASLWTDNATHISRESFHILDAGLTAGSTTAGLDGDGTYAFYDPDKGAFRGGAISGGNAAWEDTNIGTNSFAWGLNAQASGPTSFAIGTGNVASGDVSLAVGDSSVAGGDYSTAIGALATANGDYSTAIGIGTSAIGANSTAIGISASAIGANSTAIGIKASASGEGAMAFGLTTVANNPATAPIVSGDESFGIFMGNQSGIDITDNNTMAILGGDFIVGSYQFGDTTTGTQDSRMFFDRSSGAFRAGTTAGTQWNSANVGANSTALGANTTASGDGSMAIGGDTTASGENSTAIGDSATASGDSSMAIGDSTTASGAVSIAMGEGTTASGEVSAAWGVDTIASGYASVTWGQATIASGENSIAIGRETSAGSGTAGDGAGDNSFAVGLQSATQTTNPIITGDRSMVLYMDGGGANANNAYDFTASDKFAIIGGEFQIDDVSSSANKGCIRYNSATTKIQFSHDCSTFSDMGGGGGSGAINDLSDAAKSLTTNNLFLAHSGGSVGATDNFNTVIGIEALDALNNSSADNNIAIGYQALTANTNGDDNIAIGYQALSITTNGSDNIAIGSETLLVNSTGDRNVAIGNSALIANTLGDDNIVLGDGAMEENTSGNDNIAIGNTALGDNINGDDNIAIGTQALEQNTDGDDNIAIGDGALTDAGSSQYSIAIGVDALGNFDGAANTYNTAIGYRSLRGTNGATTGIENTALGANAGLVFTTGENNVLIGYNSGNSITTGSDNIIIGHDADTPAATTSNYLNIGNTITGNISTKTVTIDAQSNAAGGLILTTDEGGQVDDLLILNNTNGGGNAAGITFKVTDTSRSRIYSYDSGMIIETLAATTPIVFQTNTTQRMVISDSGIGIGNFNADTIESALHIQSGDIRLDGGAANEAGCIRFNDTTDQLQFSHDCSTYTAMGSASGLAINDLTDAYTDYTTDNNMFIGSGAGAAIASGGAQNIFIGESSGALITTSDGNTAVGFETLDVNTSGEYQAAFGSGTLTNNTTGTKNAAFGASAMFYNTDGSNNVALGHLAGRGNGGGASPENSAFIGYYSGLNITTGINNTLLGYNTGATLTTGGNNILIGASTNVPTSSTSNYLNIGNTIYGDLSNGLVGIGTASPTGKLDVITANNSSDTILRIGSGVDNSNTANSTLELRERNGGTYNRGVDLVYNGATGDHFAINVINSGGTTEALRILRSNGYVGINNAAPDAELDVTGDIEYSGTLTDVSDRRLKDNIKPLGQTLDRITQIDTYSFTMKDDKKGRTEFGVMAQELEEIFPTLVHTAKDKMGTKSVNYVGLIAPMIEATKELRAENAALKAELSGVKTAQAQTTQALKDLSQQVALLNKMAGNNVGKASMMPYFMLLFGLLGGMGFMLLIQRKQQK